MKEFTIRVDITLHAKAETEEKVVVALADMDFDFSFDNTEGAKITSIDLTDWNIS